MAESKGLPAKRTAKRLIIPQMVDDKNSSSSSSGSNHESRDDSMQLTGVTKLGVLIDRDEYLQAYRDLQADYATENLKNSILQRRMAEYYKKRKLDHALKEVDGVQATQLEEKYHQKLLAYEELKKLHEKELTEIQSKLNEQEHQHDDRLQEAENKFQNLQHLEKNTGTGLIYFNKGKPIADKTVERLVKLQRCKTEQTAALRLRYLRARNAVTDLEATVRRLETIAPGLTVAYYNQLCVDEQNYNDKIEERENELIKSRGKVTEYNQMLGHIREKMHHTSEMIDTTEGDFGEVEMEWLRAREDLNQVKSRRDSLRIQLISEQEKVGLLIRPDLLRDYEAATDELQVLQKEKAALEESIANATKELRAYRKMIRNGGRKDSGVAIQVLKPEVTYSANDLESSGVVNTFSIKSDKIN